MCMYYYFFNVNCFLNDKVMGYFCSLHIFLYLKEKKFFREKRTNLVYYAGTDLWEIQSGPLSATLTQVQEFPYVLKSNGSHPGIWIPLPEPPPPPHPPVLETCIVSSF